MKRVPLALLIVVLGMVFLSLLAAGFVEASLRITRLLHLRHVLGMDTQTTYNYDSVSGVLPIMVTALGFTGVLVTAWRRWNCHEAGCWRHGKYEIEGGVRCCDLHHPALDTRPVGKRGHVHALHTAHLAHVARHASPTP
jgi:hypothetical protein